jgi:hypothetical protein
VLPFKRPLEQTYVSANASRGARYHNHLASLRERWRLRVDGWVYITIDLLGEGVPRGELVWVASHFGDW